MKIWKQCTNQGCRSKAKEKFSNGQQLCTLCLLLKSKLDENNNFVCNSCKTKTKITKDEIPKCSNKSCQPNYKNITIGIICLVFGLLWLTTSLKEPTANNTKTNISASPPINHFDLIPYYKFSEFKDDLDFTRRSLYLEKDDKDNENRGMRVIWELETGEWKKAYIKIGVNCQFLFENIYKWMESDGISIIEIEKYEESKIRCLRETTGFENINLKNDPYVFWNLNNTFDRAVKTTKILKNSNLLKYFHPNMGDEEKNIIIKKLTETLYTEEDKLKW